MRKPDGLAAKQLVLECRLDAPWGTAEKPVEVTSAFSERIVGVPDPYDDSIVWRAYFFATYATLCEDARA